MHQITIFNLGNADTSRIDLANGKKLLIDYANMRCATDPKDKRIDLPVQLRADLKTAKRDYYDVVAFTHLDNDHTCGASEFFELLHAAKYQGGDRVKIKELWVPAAVLVEDGCEDETRILRQEARYRLKKGEGIRVFSGPGQLTDWLATQGPYARRPAASHHGCRHPDSWVQSSYRWRGILRAFSLLPVARQVAA